MDDNGSPRPWRITDSDPCIIHDANGGLVAALWSRVRGEGRGRADAALIVAAVNGSPAHTLTVQPNDVVVVTSGRDVEMKKLHLALKARFPEWRGFVILTTPGGDALTCVDKRALYERLRAEFEGPPAQRRDCVLPLGHSGPCIPAEPAWHQPLARLAPPQPCPRDPVCDQRAGHDGPCRYEFPAGSPAAPASTCVPSCALAVGHPGPCFGPSPLECAGQHARESMARREGDARATLSADCARPLEHAPGCQCGVL